MPQPLRLSSTAISLAENNMEKITYDEFSNIEITLGTILSVEVVPDADKLLRLSVDCGEETPRQILSGIRTYFEDPQVLVGKQCPFVTNLAPRTIRGLESNGMILAGNSEETFALFHPSVPLPAGTRLK